MNTEQLERIREGKGFLAALDQSGGSTPKALALYGIDESSYDSEEEMYALVHAMRTRIITSPGFSSEYILGAILFQQTLRSQIEGLDTANFLWQQKGIIPFLKIDEGLSPLEDGVQLMKPMPQLEALLAEAKEKHVFGTKMRSVIQEYNPEGIKRIVDQQFEVARQIMAAGLVPIIEPEVDIHSDDKQKIEQLLRDLLLSALETLDSEQSVIFKLTLPNEANFYTQLIEHPRVLRVVALSGGYSRDQANELLAQNHGLIASFSRALSEGLRVDQTDEEFDATLLESVKSIYQASIT
jgi:fructose-bisphosphate aldolase class I